MSTRAAWGLGLALVGAVGLAASWSDESSSSEDDTRYLTDRLWIDRMPDGDRDMVGKLAVVRSIDHGRFGVTEFSSVWRRQSEVFQWRLEGNVLHTAWPQDGEHLSIELSTRECEGEAPAPFELCLDFIDEGEVHTIYSRHDWVIRPREDGDDLVDDPLVAAWLDAVVHALPRSPVAEPPTWGPQAPSRARLWLR